MLTGNAQTNSAASRGARPTLNAPALRYLGLLLLLTPLLGGVRLLLGHEALTASPQVVTQVVEVPYPVYVEVPGSNAGARQVPDEGASNAHAVEPDAPSAPPDLTTAGNEPAVTVAAGNIGPPALV